tara:strand:+ start:461 stop:775 length:315 start_codon:yes stop_codon:yes gene_type:complete
MKSINAQELKELFEDKINFTLLDVREKEELDMAKINPHTHIPMGEITERLSELNKDMPIVVMCHSGVRSARVCNYLTDHGYNVKNLMGGINSWSIDIDPTVPQY